MMKHKRVSGNANLDPDKLGGEDWDDPHVYPVGSVFLYGLGEVLYEGEINVVSQGHGGVLDATYDNTGGFLQIQIDVAGLPIPAGAAVEPLVICNWSRKTLPDYCFIIDSYDPVTGIMALYSHNAGLGEDAILAVDFGVMAQVHLKVIQP